MRSLTKIGIITLVTGLLILFVNCVADADHEADFGFIPEGSAYFDSNKMTYPES
jgi:hypothetical protein